MLALGFVCSFWNVEMTFLDVYRKSAELIANKAPFVLATLVRSIGSTPQKTGAHAIFEPTGKVFGTLGGGCLEAEARKRALDALDDGQSRLFHVKLDDISGWDDGLICGGQATILVQPNPSNALPGIQALIEAADQGASGALQTTISRGERTQCESKWIPESFSPDCVGEHLSEAVQSVLQKETATLLGDPGKGNEELRFIEPYVPRPELLIAGAGHVGKAVAQLASMLGFRVTVVDDRSEFASSENIPWADEVICADIPQTINEQSLNHRTYVVIVTRGHQHDGASLAACIRQPAAFIGMIGSRRKSLLIRKSLVEKGLASQEEVDRVMCPIGLDIGSVTVNEIALSIVSQMVAHRRKGAVDAGAMTFSRT